MYSWKNLQQNVCKRLSRCIICLIVTVAALPLAISSSKEDRCGYVVLLMAAFWMIEPVPIAVTALMPVILFPLLNILGSNDVCSQYINDAAMVAIGGMIFSIAFTRHGLHERIALKVLVTVGSDMKWVLLCIMCVTAFMSMWINNAAATAMILPIVESVLNMVAEQDENSRLMHLTVIPLESLADGNNPEISENDYQENRQSKEVRTCLKLAFLLSICYSSNIGGTCTLTGCGPNTVFSEMLARLHLESREVTFDMWMVYNIPGVILCLFLAWSYLYFLYLRKSMKGQNSDISWELERILLERYQKLGRASFQEKTVGVLFLLMISLWIFKSPKHMNGWSDAMELDVSVGNSLPPIGAAFLLFVIPSDKERIFSGPPLLDWKSVVKNMEWGVVILVGGGFALARGSMESGLSAFIARELSSMSLPSPVLTVAVTCFVAVMITQTVFDTPAATILIPVVDYLAIHSGMNPLYLIIPVTVICSYGFMLPAATGPNALVYEKGHLKITHMMKPGLAMNIACCSVQVLLVNTLGVLLFDLDKFPSWAHNVYNSTSMGHLETQNTTDSFTV